MITLTEVLAILNIIFIIGIPLGAILALRIGFANAAKETEKRVRDALVEENTILQSKIGRLEKEITRLNNTLTAIQKILADQGLIIKISNEVVTLTDDRARHSRTVSVRIDSDELPALDKEQEKN